MPSRDPIRSHPRAAGSAANRSPSAWAHVTIDCRDPERLAAFWGQLLAAPPRSLAAGGWFAVGPTVAGGPALYFQPVPEAKVGKARAHLDLWVEDLGAAVELVEGLGGRRLSGPEARPGGTLTVMADPEGTEFCLIAVPSP